MSETEIRILGDILSAPGPIRILTLRMRYLLGMGSRAFRRTLEKFERCGVVEIYDSGGLFARDMIRVAD